VEGAIVEHALIGRRAVVRGSASRLNVGDDSSVVL